jgi:GTP-binding protein HflX
VPRILVFSKIDRVGDEAAQREREKALCAQHPGCVVINAKRESDIARLRAAILAFFQSRLITAELFLPWSSQQLRGAIFSNCEVLEERADTEGAFLRVRGEPEYVERLRQQLVH